MRFILDHSLSPRLVEVLSIIDSPAGHAVIHLKQYCPGQTTDPVWLKLLAEQEPDGVAVTADPRILRSPHARAAWLEAGLTTFFPKSFADLPLDEQAWRLIKWWRAIVHEAGTVPRGSGRLLKYLPLRSRFAWSLSNLVALLRMNLFTHRDLWAWLDRPFEGPPTVLTAAQGVLDLG